MDIICAQGGEGGGHTGDTPFSILIPAVVDLCKGAKSPLTGEPIMVVAAGGISDGRGLAVALSYGAAGVWVGTRFVASEEAGAPPKHKELVVSAGYDDTVRTLIYSGRPMSVRKTPYVASWYVGFLVYMNIPNVSSHRLGKTIDARRLKSWSLTARYHTTKNWRCILKNQWKVACVSTLYALYKYRLTLRIGLMGKVAGSVNVGFFPLLIGAYV